MTRRGPNAALKGNNDAKFHFSQLVYRKRVGWFCLTRKEYGTVFFILPNQTRLY